MQVTNRRSLLRDHASELRLGGRENRRAKIINGMEKKEMIAKARALELSEVLPVFWGPARGILYAAQPT